MNGFALVRHKHGRRCVLAKVVIAYPTGETVVATPVRNRRFSTPSLPIEAIDVARRAGASAWVVRFDTDRRCYRLPIELALDVGYIGDDGELYVPLAMFRRSPWLDWEYVEDAVEI